MSRHFYHNVDRNQKEIVIALRKCGALVASLSATGNGFPDLVVEFRERIFLLEVKNPKGRGKKLTPEQEIFHMKWRNVQVVTNITEAMKAIGVEI